MPTWEISNYYKKQAVERQFWTKNGLTIIKDEGFRWGLWEHESEQRPELDLTNPDGFEPSADDIDWELIELEDGSWVEWVFPDRIDEEEQERIQALWDEDFFEGLESDGWQLDETEFWIFGPIRIKNKETGEEWNGDSE